MFLTDGNDGGPCYTEIISLCISTLTWLHWPFHSFVILRTIFSYPHKKKKDLSLRLDNSIAKNSPLKLPSYPDKKSSKYYRKYPYYSYLWVKSLKTGVERRLGIYPGRYQTWYLPYYLG